MSLEYLQEYVKTEAEQTALDAVLKHGSNQKAAKAVGKARQTIDEAINRIKRRAATQGHSPEHDMTKTVPDGYLVKGVSTYYDDEGKPRGQWVKSQIDRDRQAEIIKEFVESFCTDLQPIEEIKAPKRKLNKDLIPWFQIGDAHIGMLAHEAEVGHNFDLKIAERELVKAMFMLIDQAPNCERCVIQDLGDATHYENFSGTTEASGHALDLDGRFPKMIHVYARIMRRMIDKALTKFKYVDVIVNQGNHSRTNDIWMAVFLRNVYEKNKRLHVLNNSSVFIPYRMGNTFVLCHHTDKCKPEKLAGVMSNDFHQDWGETKYRYIDGGHIHTRKQAYEIAGAIYESWNQIAPSDKYAHDHGWRSRSCLTVVMRSKTYGEKGRITLTAEEVKDVLDKLPAGTTAAARREVYTVT